MMIVIPNATSLEQQLQQTAANWRRGLNVLSLLHKRMTQAEETYGIDLSESAKVLKEAVVLAKEVDRDLYRASKKIWGGADYSKHRVAGAFKSLWKFVERPLKLYGAWGALKGHKMYMTLAVHAVKMFSEGLKRQKRAVKVSRQDPDGEIQEILSSAEKKTKNIARILGRVRKTLDAVEIQ